MQGTAPRYLVRGGRSRCWKATGPERVVVLRFPLWLRPGLLRQRTYRQARRRAEGAAIMRMIVVEGV
jgi:uncharacterized protein (DUF1330 family)